MTDSRRRGLRRAAASLLLLMAAALATGCSDSFSSKTIVIPGEEERAASPGKLGDAFEAGAIYKLSAKGVEYGDWLGWLDDDSLLAAFRGRDGMIRLSSADYRYDTRRTLSAPESKIGPESLSPDGRRVAWEAWEDDGVKLLLRDVATDGTEGGRAAPIVDEKAGDRLGGLSWSGDGRYLAYAKKKPAAGREKPVIVVYDADRAVANEYEIADWSGEEIGDVRVSDDGTAAAAFFSSDGYAGVKIGELAGGAFREWDEFASDGDGLGEFASGRRFVFATGKGSLVLYDPAHASTVALAERVAGFRLSPDRELIAYSDYGEEALIVAKLQGNNLLGARPIYRGLLSPGLLWSPDGRKLLVNGGKATVPMPSSPAESDSPFVIELK